VKYGEVRLADEQQFSTYNFEAADVAGAWKHFELCEAECKGLLDRYAELNRETSDERKIEESIQALDKIRVESMVREKARFPLLGAYDLCLKCSHYFNILDARGAISVTERVGVIARVRTLAVGVAKAWMDQQYGTGKKTEKRNQGAKPAAQEKKGKLAPVGS
jgi:glycyl-tRNA synthetase alpha chain